MTLDKAGKPVISEKVFAEHIRKAAIITGWRVYHTYNSMRSVKGFPDFVLIHRKKRRVIFAEVKTETGKVTAEQTAWIDDLESIMYSADTDVRPMVEAYLWRPSQMDQIWELLRKE